MQDKSLYENMSSPTATPTAILVEAGIAAATGKQKASIDIGGAYLNADMAPTGVVVHMTIDAYLTSLLVQLDPTYRAYVRPNGTVVVRLRKALYGTVEASRLWYNMMVNVLKEVAFKPNPFEQCVLNKVCGDGTLLTVVLYVDDLLIFGSAAGIAWLKSYLESKFPEVTYHTGDVIDYVGMTLDFASTPGSLSVTMKQITDDIIGSCGVTIGYATPAASNLFDADPSAQRLSSDEEAYFRTFVAKLLLE